MDLLEIGGIVPPSPTKYDISFGEINGTEEMLENGDTYIERIKSGIPTISVSWVNLKEADALEIMQAVTLNARFDCKYCYMGTVETGYFRCKSPKVTLKLDTGTDRYFDVALTLDGC